MNPFRGIVKMEEKKLDLNSIIGFVLIFGIVMWMMYNSQQSSEKEAQEKAAKAKTEKAQKSKATDSQKIAEVAADSTVSDSSKLKSLQAKLGAFAYSATLPSAKDAVLENDLLKITVSTKGGAIQEVVLKKFEKFKKNSGELVSLIKNNNANFNLEFQTSDNRTLNTKDLFFEPSLSKIGDKQVLSMKLKTGPNAFLEYKYVLKNNDYMLDFDIRSQGLNKVLNPSKPAALNWDMKTYRNEKSISYENRYTETVYEYEDGKDSYLSQGSEKEETPEKVTYVAYKQHLFTSVLLTKTPFQTAKLTAKDLTQEVKNDSVFTKEMKTVAPLAYTNGELDYKMNWFFGPADYKILNSYDRNLDEIVSLGWGIFGWINKLIFVPLFGLLSSFLPYGLAIILFTILIKLAMSPITFKSFLSQAKMKVLRPELMEINEKYGKDPMKKQQETMALYNKAGVNPLAGCIPALIQLPFMYASFMFFPTSVDLRQKSFLWADDLSSFDSIVKLPFNIPLYGNHISLFALLAAVAIFFYMKMTSGDQSMAQPPQDGMPDMGKIMKMMIWISPIMMLIFFNNYGSGLSLYNFISNLVTIGIMLVIKRYFIDSDKIHAQIQENKLKPKTESKFQKKMREAMEQAEAQKAQQKKK